jgi:predicted outer membrane protein
VRLAPQNAPPAKFAVRQTMRAASVPALCELLVEVEQQMTEGNAAGGFGLVLLNAYGESRTVATVRTFQSLAEVERGRANLAVSGNEQTLAFAKRIAPLLADADDNQGFELLQTLAQAAT